jgi:hypothetical protein
MENLFLSLSKLSPFATEDQLTESLVALLRVLLERCPIQGLWLANSLCNLPQDDGFSLRELTIHTQPSTPVGTPDIGLWDNRTRAYIEVKHDSWLGEQQLERYHRELQTHKVPQTRLVLLARSRAWAAGTTLECSLYHHVCWYEVHDWLDALPLDDAVSVYLVQSFTEFLEAKGMSIDKVTWEYMQGVPAMLRLVQMLEAAVADVLRGEPTTKTAGWRWCGLYLTRKDLFLGLRYTAPLLVVCENNRGTNPTFKRSFDLEEEHFFSLKAGQQLERLTAWVRRAYEEAPVVAQPAPTTGPTDEAEDSATPA